MGHLTGKDAYRRLGGQLDGLSGRAPWSEALRAILAELYTEAEADFVARMPSGASGVERLQAALGMARRDLELMLGRLADRGLVLDITVDGKTYYAPSPMVIGVFEFTMMRRGRGQDVKKLARLFHDYLEGGRAFFEANCGDGKKVSIMRALPHEGAFGGEPVEVLDYEKAVWFASEAGICAVGACSCRVEKSHLDASADHAPRGAAPGEGCAASGAGCAAPVELCSSFGVAAEYVTRHGLGRGVEKPEMLDLLARSRELGLVFCADNVRRNGSFICHCCGCCCTALLGISRHGFPNSVVTSSFICAFDEARCSGCGACARACPISAIKMLPVQDAPSPALAGARGAADQAAGLAARGEAGLAPAPSRPGARRPVLDEGICLGCGVCCLKCPRTAARLVKREARVLHPETTFQRIILQALERDTLQNQLFDDPGRLDHRFLRAFLGGFLRLPAVKRALMSDRLRSTFLAAMETGARLGGKGWALDL